MEKVNFSFEIEVMHDSLWKAEHLNLLEKTQAIPFIIEKVCYPLREVIKDEKKEAK